MVKNALVVYKKSAYEIYALDRGGVLFKKDRKLKASHERHRSALEGVKRILLEKRIRFRMVYRASRFDASRFDFVISVGGDGTFLEAARNVKDQPILGVNSDPGRSVGIFCGTDAGSFKKIFERILREKEKARRLNRLRVFLNGKFAGFNVLNDILLCHENPAMMSRYNIRIGKKSEEHKDSGLWISTAAGSSGAIKSAGGRVLPLESKQIQYRPRELYSGRGERYGLYGGVIERPDNLEVISLMREGILYIDGPHIKMRLGYGDRLTVLNSPYPLKVYGGSR